jgi:hypothetical protein
MQLFRISTLKLNRRDGSCCLNISVFHDASLQGSAAVSRKILGLCAHSSLNPCTFPRYLKLTASYISFASAHDFAIPQLQVQGIHSSPFEIATGNLSVAASRWSALGNPLINNIFALLDMGYIQS